MAETNENVAYLAQAIGPRPAGTEEEQQAALYITEQLQAESGLAAVIEDFNCSPDYDLPKAALVVVSLLMALLAMLLQVMAVPALIVCLVMAVLVITETAGKTSLSNLLGNGVSQNVVAKYVPAADETGAPRRRKVILVAHYDSGKVRKDIPSGNPAMLRIFKLIGIIGICVIPVIMLIRSLVTFGGVSLIVINVLTVAAMVCAALPLVGVVMNRTAAYNEAANCNASGVAVLMEVARRVGGGGRVGFRTEPRPRAKSAEIHGEEAVREAGLIPDEAELVYEMKPEPAVADPDLPEGSPEARLLSAKAAIAALTGKPVSNTLNISFEDSEPAKAEAFDGNSDGEDVAVSAESASAADLDDPGVLGEGAVAEAEGSAGSVEPGETAEDAVVLEASAEGKAVEASSQAREVPAWFKSAQEKARKPVGEEAPIRRSRYADALDAAARESAARAEAEAQAASRAAVAATEDRLRQMRESIMEARLAVAEKAVSATDENVQNDKTDQEQGQLNSVGTAAELTANAAVTAAQAAAATPAAVGAATAIAAGAQVVASAGVEGDLVSAAQKRPSVRKKRAIALPNIAKNASRSEDGETSNDSSNGEGKLSAIRNLRTKLPSIGGASGQSDVVKEKAAKLANLPSLDLTSESGAAAASRVMDEMSAEAVLASSEAQDDLGATQMFQPYSENDVRDFVSEMESVIRNAESGTADVRASQQETHQVESEDLFTEEGFDVNERSPEPRANANVSRETRRSGYSNMPKSRIQGFLSRFSKDGERRSVRDEHVTPQEWLDVDKDFDARAVGAARGGWESFRQDEGLEAAYEDRGTRYSGELEAAFSDDSDDFGAPVRKKRRWEGGSASRERIGRVSMLSGYEDEAARYEASQEEEERIYGFRHPDVNVEVWFVALGSELAANGGMNAFMAEHAADLKGAIIIELEGLGAGDLAMVESEGLLKPCSSPSRMRRYVTKASSELGLSVARASINWRDTTSAFAMRRGYQALHLIGLKDGKPAYFGQEDDILENVDEEILMQNADFVMELLKQI